MNRMKLSPRATTAADMIIQSVIAFQAKLAPLDRVCDVMIDCMEQLKGTANLTEDTVTRMEDAIKAISGLEAATNGLKLIAPAMAIIAGELET
jgi:hypothetical protein